MSKSRNALSIMLFSYAVQESFLNLLINPIHERKHEKHHHQWAILEYLGSIRQSGHRYHRRDHYGQDHKPR